MSYAVYTGVESSILDRLNNPVVLPFSSAGLALGGLTLIFSNPSHTITFSGAAGAVKTIGQVIAAITAANSSILMEVRGAQQFQGSPAGRQLYLVIWRSAGFTISAAGTANALLGLSTTAATVSVGGVDPSAITAFSEGATEGHYALVLGTAAPTVGTTGARPAAATVGAGFTYFDTTLGIPIWSNGAAYVNATGTVV